MEAGYQTRQKRQILQCLMENAGSALTVDALTDRINAAGHCAGRTTVYRFVEKLASQGQVRKFPQDRGKSATYQYLPHPDACEKHLHLKCSRCGKFIHLDCEILRQMDSHILEEHGFRVDHAKSVLFGLCEDCRKEEHHGAD